MIKFGKQDILEKEKLIISTFSYLPKMTREKLLVANKYINDLTDDTYRITKEKSSLGL